VHQVQVRIVYAHPRQLVCALTVPLVNLLHRARAAGLDRDEDICPWNPARLDACRPRSGP
jgi:hypothetical protein